MDKINFVSKGASLSISDEKLLIEFDRDMNSLSTALWAGGYRRQLACSQSEADRVL